MKNICFVANYTKTYFFDALADQLKTKDIGVYWIIVNKGNYDYLSNKYPSENLLYLPKDKLLSAHEQPLDEFKLNELIWGDRVLKYNYGQSLKYLINIQKPIYDFVQKNDIISVLGEVTWAHELLICRMMSQIETLNTSYLNMHTVRIPSGRFAFFLNEFQSEFLIREKNYEHLTLPENAFELRKPNYLAINDAKQAKSRTVAGRLNRLKKLFTGENMDPNDITLLPSKSKQRSIIPIKNELNKESYKRVKTFPLEYLKDKKFIFATLHKQPEASIDVLGRYVEDQFLNIETLWRILPHDWYIVVKEHTNAIGDRPYSWFKRLGKYNRILFANEKIDSYHLIDHCQAVYTVSGTVAYEAALKHKPALVLADLFFNLPYVKKVTMDDFKKNQNLLALLDEIPDPSIDEELVKKMIFFNSFEGDIGDPLNMPNCMNEDNIISVSAALEEAILIEQSKR